MKAPKDDRAALGEPRVDLGPIRLAPCREIEVRARRRQGDRKGISRQIEDANVGLVRYGARTHAAKQLPEASETERFSD